MFWGDKLLENVKGTQIINDSWTPSGMVHMGSLKGPVIHDTLFRILKEKGEKVKFMYGFDDADPLDGLPPELRESHGKYLGVPLFKTPAPSGTGTFAEYFGRKMKNLLDSLGIKPDELYKTSELYKKGVFNKAITFVLDHAEGIRRVYGETYKKQIPSIWYPIQVMCPNCGKLGTTKVTGWDGKEVAFTCEKNLVKWAEGCSYSGRISPYDGNGKMPWKVEWAAKWWTFGVTIEGAGKDHASAGGSYDIAMRLCNDVFKVKQPLKFAYEHFLIGGKKMSSSKGLGLSASGMLEILPPQVLRFLMVKTKINQAIDFDPSGDKIPKLFDEYQKVGDAYFQKADKDNIRIFELSQMGEIKKPPRVRFSVLAQWVQMPNMEETIKQEGLIDWVKYAKVWIEKYAPESEKFLVQKELPEAARSLSEEQKQYLQKISSELDKKWNAEDFQKELYELSKQLNLPSKDAFSAIYLSLIGKNHGPKAAWLILSLDKNFVKKRFKEV